MRARLATRLTGHVKIDKRRRTTGDPDHYRHHAGDPLMRLTRLALLSAALLLAPPLWAEEPPEVFSGPQAGEGVTPFTVRGVLGPQAGSEYDLVKTADGKPLVVVFLNELTRPSVGLSRLVLGYAASRREDGLHSGLVLLTADATATEEWVKRASGALPPRVPIGISPDGAEGPGAYGLNRNVAMTVIVAKDGKVTANFALVQPSVAADAPKIAAAIAEAVGAEAPTLEELERLSGPMRRRE
jgi:hypothetical protein